MLCFVVLLYESLGDWTLKCMVSDQSLFLVYLSCILCVLYCIYIYIRGVNINALTHVINLKILKR